MQRKLMIEAIPVLCNELSRVGFDLHKLFHVSWYNKVVPTHLHLPTNRSGLLIGNTSKIWKPFKNSMLQNTHVPINPLDNYTTTQISSILDHWNQNYFKGTLEYEIRWVHDTHPKRIVAVQKLAHCSGLAYLCPKSYLSIHPQYGPWIAFRAVVLFNETLSLEKPIEISHPDPMSAVSMEEATNKALCSPNNWRMWLAVRKACKLGSCYEYSNEQILYHYTKNLEIFSTPK